MSNENLNKGLELQEEIISKFKNFFRDEIAASHSQNIRKLRSLTEFKINPFLDTYNANILTGNSDSISKAKALVYPRVLGTSINTTFGNKFQKFCSQILEGYASTTSGIDIEFIDKIDGRRKYCQLKAGPDTINKDDVSTINNHFQSIRNLARTNNSTIGITDLVIGILYGEHNQINGNYKSLEQNYIVYVGKEFWYHLTGDDTFYQQLIDAADEVAKEYDGTQLLEEVISLLAKDIDNN